MKIFHRILKNASLIFFMLLIVSTQLSAQGPGKKEFGFGIVLGEPTGLTMKYWLSGKNALDVSLGGSYFGSPRIGVDYVWHFDAFHTSYLLLYAGPGVALGIGEGKNYLYKVEKGKFYSRNSGSGIAVRGVVGLDFIPKRLPLDIFLEVGLLVGFSPSGTAFDSALGIRFYP